MSEHTPQGIDIRRAGQWLVLALLLSEVFLIFGHITVNWYDGYSSGAQRLFHVDREGNLPSWFSSMQFFLLAIILMFTFLAERVINPDKRLTWFWLLASAGALFLSADEGARLHERFGTLLYRAVRNADEGSALQTLSSFPSYYWALIYVPLALPAIAILVWFFWRELGKMRALPIVGMILFLIGAVVLDYLEGRYGNDEHKPWEVNFLGFNEIVDTALIEEAFEMVGVTLVVTGCLFHLARLVIQIRVNKIKPQVG